ncbi:MAG: hypothetical protein FWF59_13220 [Turicibacter sp.]|nr:hypothetical protein [Turicibacter sp.]
MQEVNQPLIEGLATSFKLLSKIAATLTAVFLLGLYLVPTGSVIHASIRNEPVLTNALLTQTREVTRFFATNASIPATIHYNNNGWSGILNRISINTGTGNLVVRFSGTVRPNGGGACTPSGSQVNICRLP